MKWIFVIAAGVYVAALLALYVEQRRLIYFNVFNDEADGGPASAGFAEAATLGLTTSDDERLVAWYVAPKRGKMLALFFHGNGGPLSRRGPVLRALTRDGMGILAIDYRGFGASTGAPSEAGLHLDADAAYAKARELGYVPGEILLVGESLGTGVAVNLATRREIAGIVLDAPYSSTVAVAAERYWMFPVSLLMKDQFRSDAIIAQIKAPLLVMHGELDRTIPISFGEKLFALAPEPKTFLRIADAGHSVLRRPDAQAKLDEWVAGLGRSAK